LADQLPKVRAFLETHRSHEVIYGTSDDLGYNCPDDELAFLEWIDDTGSELLPRYFAERLGHKNWSEVQTYIEGLHEPPLWWDYPDMRSRAWRVFRDANEDTASPVGTG
jgi:hypothetical protein